MGVFLEHLAIVMLLSTAILQEISRLLMAGMSTSKNGRSRQEGRSSSGAWVTPVVVGL